jgi:hypothetical protein
MSFFEELTVGKLAVFGGGNLGASPVLPSVVVKHKQIGHKVSTTFTLTNVPLTITNALKYAGLLLWTFPQGRIIVEGATATLNETTTSVVANIGASPVASVGSAAATATTLSGTMVSLIPSTALPVSATINVAATTNLSAPLAASTQLDGNTTAIPVYLNVALPNQVTNDATATFSGQITIHWANLGTY